MHAWLWSSSPCSACSSPAVTLPGVAEGADPEAALSAPDPEEEKAKELIEQVSSCGQWVPLEHSRDRQQQSVT